MDESRRPDGDDDEVLSGSSAERLQPPTAMFAALVSNEMQQLQAHLTVLFILEDRSLLLTVDLGYDNTVEICNISLYRNCKNIQ